MKNLYPIKLTQLLFASLLLLLAGLWVRVGQSEAETAVTPNPTALPSITVAHDYSIAIAAKLFRKPKLHPYRYL